MSDIRLDWEPGKLKARIIQDLIANADIVGKFVSDDAKRRLRAYPELNVKVPGRRLPYVGGGVYRAYVASLMTWDVTPDKNGVTIRVGVGTGRGGSHHGLYIELGSKTAPARPFLRPAVLENRDKIVLLLANR